ncbi:hypothetical protein [Afipia sp. DC4300-2b1]|uniref:hypothetical protein n=1 Tax=Afipia sp. DC4300-2b1 TaxID=2804672 RepID=UPI003CEFE65D
MSKKNGSHSEPYVLDKKNNRFPTKGTQNPWGHPGEKSHPSEPNAPPSRSQTSRLRLSSAIETAHRKEAWINGFSAYLENAILPIIDEASYFLEAPKLASKKPWRIPGDRV